MDYGSLCGLSTLRSVPLVWSFKKKQFIISAFFVRMLGNGLDIDKVVEFYFTTGELDRSPIPDETVLQWFAVDNGRAIPYSLTVGIRFYLNGYVEIPSVAGLIEKGMLQGAAMAFMVVGGESSIPAAIGVNTLVRRAVFFSYLIFGLGASFLAGYGFQLR